MGSYRREYEDYYRGLKSGQDTVKVDVQDVYELKTKSVGRSYSYGRYGNSIPIKNERRGLTKNERPVVTIIYNQVVGAMVLFIILGSFASLKGIGKSELYVESKKMIEKNYTVEDITEIFNLGGIIGNFKNPN